MTNRPLFATGLMLGSMALVVASCGGGSATAKPLELDISQLPKPPTSELLKNERPLPDIDIERLVKGE